MWRDFERGILSDWAAAEIRKRFGDGG
jgi:hypothetical protein